MLGLKSLCQLHPMKQPQTPTLAEPIRSHWDTFCRAVIFVSCVTVHQVHALHSLTPEESRGADLCFNGPGRPLGLSS